MNIFLDLDGVVVDMARASMKLFNMSDEQIDNLYEEWPLNVREINKVIGVSSSKFWKRVKKEGPGFWENLPEYKWTQELLKLVESYDPYFCFLTSSTLDPACAYGKMLWAIKNRFDFRTRMIVHTAKQRLAYNNILIDDSHNKIDPWNAAGGNGILFPQRWNGLVVEDKIAYVKNKLDQYVSPIAGDLIDRWT